MYIKSYIRIKNLVRFFSSKLLQFKKEKKLFEKIKILFYFFHIGKKKLIVASIKVNHVDIKA